MFSGEAITKISRQILGQSVPRRSVVSNKRRCGQRGPEWSAGDGKSRAFQPVSKALAFSLARWEALEGFEKWHGLTCLKKMALVIRIKVESRRPVRSPFYILGANKGGSETGGNVRGSEKQSFSGRNFKVVQLDQLLDQLRNRKERNKGELQGTLKQ